MAGAYLNAEITPAGQALIDGNPVNQSGFADLYGAIYAHVAELSRQAGHPLLVRGTDPAQGEQEAWFTVDAAGHAQAASPAEQAADPVRQTAGPVGQTAGPGLAPSPPPTAQAPQAPSAPTVAEASESAVLYVRPVKSAPRSGFRGAMHRWTGGAINLGPSARQLAEEAREERIARRLARPFSTAFLSFKGGIGKTSTTVGVGLVLAEMRGAPPVAIDANPDSGDLAERLLGEGIMSRRDTMTVSDLVRDLGTIDSLTGLSRYVLSKGRYHFVAGEQDPAVSDSLTASDYTRVFDLLRHYYSVILTDCGTGVTHNAMRGILDKSDNVVVAAGYAVSGAKRAASTLEWLSEHGYRGLATEAIVVLTDKDDVSARVQKSVIRDHLAARCRAVFVVPNDPSVADGDRISLANLKPRTRVAFEEVAAAIVDGYREHG